jgi:DNA-binding LytR/AlgR family response regulator
LQYSQVKKQQIVERNLYRKNSKLAKQSEKFSRVRRSELVAQEKIKGRGKDKGKG